MTASVRRATLASAALGAAILLTACGPAGGSGGPSRAATSAPARSSSATGARSEPETSTPSASVSPPASSPAVTAQCAPSQLKATVNTAQTGSVAGSFYVPIDFTNVSAQPCTLYGYPGVSLVTSPSGTQLGRSASRDPAVQPSTVTLAPGARAHATLNVAYAGNYDPADCRPVTAHWLRIYPPDRFTPIYAAFTAQACSVKTARLLSVYVIRPGPGIAGRP